MENSNRQLAEVTPGVIDKLNFRRGALDPPRRHRSPDRQNFLSLRINTAHRRQLVK